MTSVKQLLSVCLMGDHVSVLMRLVCVCVCVGVCVCLQEYKATATDVLLAIVKEAFKMLGSLAQQSSLVGKLH